MSDPYPTQLPTKPEYKDKTMDEYLAEIRSEMEALDNRQNTGQQVLRVIGPMLDDLEYCIRKNYRLK